MPQVEIKNISGEHLVYTTLSNPDGAALLSGESVTLEVDEGTGVQIDYYPSDVQADAAGQPESVKPPADSGESKAESSDPIDPVDTDGLPNAA